MEQSKQPTENGAFQQLSEGLRERLLKVQASIADIAEVDQYFEQTIREQLSQGESPLDPMQAKELLDAASKLTDDKHMDKRDLLICFYACFDWYNRRETDPAARNAAWEQLFRIIGPQLEGMSVYHYARSRYYLARDMEEQAIEQARKSSEIASGHIGFLNNYGEILVNQVERKLLSGDQDLLREDSLLRDDLEFIACKTIELAPHAPQKYPAYFTTCGRILTCLGRAQEAEKNFTEAQDLLGQMHQEGHRRFANEDDYLREVGLIITAQTTSSVIKSSMASWESLETERKRQEEQARLLNERMEELDAKLDDERVNMLEFLGFFSGIISFIIASVQVGSELEFAGRAALIMIMLGTLLIAFGALGGLVEGMRHRPIHASTSHTNIAARSASRKSIVMIGVGAVVIVCAVLVYIVLHAPS